MPLSSQVKSHGALAASYNALSNYVQAYLAKKHLVITLKHRLTHVFASSSSSCYIAALFACKVCILIYN